MGQTKGNTGVPGLDQLQTLSGGQSNVLNQILAMIQGNQQGAAEGFKQFLPGGGGGQAITAQANKNFQQQTLPSILNAFGAGSKGSSALNQALAAGASNLNTDLASQLSQLQLNAASGLGGLGSNQASQGLGTPAFAYSPVQQPFWKQLALAGTQAGGEVARGLLSRGSF